MRRTTMLLALLALPASLPAQSAAPAHDPATVRKAIDARNAEWVGYANKADAKGFAAFYAPNAVVIPPEGEPMTGGANIENLFAGMLSSGIKNLKFKTLSLDLNGNHAYELGLATYEAPGKDGKVVAGSDKYLVIWKLGTDGVWRPGFDAFWVPSAHAH
jgi:ketosteroid isomerase-like protein